MGTLILQDGTVIKGNSFASETECMGEIVFNTSITGYQEVLTDPSYAKQIVIMTYPEIGNYGINNDDFEADRTHVAGFIVKNHCKNESHYKSSQNMENYLKSQNIVGLDDIDTRSLVKKIREFGTMNAYISAYDLDKEAIERKIEEIQKFKIGADVIDEVSTKERYELNPEGSVHFAFIDYGVKRNILNSLTKRNCRLTVFPASVNAEEILSGGFDAVFLSNGPGDPAEYQHQIKQLEKMLGQIPIFGICLGYQLLALASGAKTYKLKYGHRGGNHPVINLENNKVMMTSQNHGYSVDISTLTNCMRATYKNLNDNTLEGFEISSLKVFATQFHPEAKPGPDDASIIFDEWVNIIQNKVNKNNEVRNEK